MSKLSSVVPIRRTTLVSLLIGLLVLPGLAGAQSVAYEKYTLPNGLTVILHEDHNLPIVAVNIWYRVGSKDEPARRSGFAHLFEHLMFMGTERVPGLDFDNIMEAGGGSNNATTSEDRTNYYETGPSSLLPTLLWLEADRLEDLGRMMTQEKLDRQREVVRNERRQSYENRPYGKADLAVYGLMFPEGHPYHIPVIGTHEDLEAATVDDVKNFFATYYVPSNASLVVAGDFDPAEVKPLIEQLFGSLPRGNDVVHASAAPVQLEGVTRVTMTDEVQYERTTMVYHSPPHFADGDGDLDLVAAVLTEGISSRLYQKLIYENELAVSVQAYQESMKLGSLFHIEAVARPGVSLDRVEAAIDEVVAELARRGPNAGELQRQVAQIEYQLVNRLQSLLAVADRLNSYEYAFGEPNSFARDLDRYRKATPQSVKRWARAVLQPERRLILRVIPQAPTPTTNPRATRPTLAASGEFAARAPTTMTLSNGIKVVHWHRPELPLMSLTTLFDGGSHSDPADEAGLAQSVAAMLSEGAGKLGAVEFANALEQLGASFSASADHETTWASLQVLTSRFSGALKLYADALRQPKMVEAEWKRIQQVRVAQLRQALDDPGTVARLVSTRAFFGDPHPYSRSPTGTADSVAGLGVDELRATLPRLITPTGATILVAGSLDAEGTRAALERALGDWKAGEATPVTAPEYPAPVNSSLRVVIVDKPEAVQTVIRFMMPAPRYDDPRRQRLQSLNTILGGTFTSRLNKNLREDHGYTYGAGSGYIMGPRVGYFVARSAVRADVTGAALGEFLKELRQIRTGDISAAEAEKARASRRTEMIEALATLRGIINQAAELVLHGRPLDNLASDLPAIAAVTAEQMNGLAKDAIPLDQALLVLVGDRGLITKQLEGLGLPTPELLDAAGDRVE